MAFTSEWVWNNINRNSDVVVEDNSDYPGFYTLSARNNWTAVRERWALQADTVYDSQQGEFVNAVTAKNGGVDFTLGADGSGVRPITGFTFSADTQYTDSTYVWYNPDNLTNINSRPVYRLYPFFPSKSTLPNFAYCFVAQWQTTDNETSRVFGWAVVEVNINDTVSDELFDYDKFAVSTTTASAAASVALTPAGQTFVGNVEIHPAGGGTEKTSLWSTNSSTASAIAEQDIPVLFCKSDNQVWPIEGVDFYKQVQTWIYKDAYADVTI